MRKIVKALAVAGVLSLASMSAFAAFPSRNSSGSSSSSSSGGSSTGGTAVIINGQTVTTTTGTAASAGTVTKVLANGQNITVQGASTAADGSVTSGLISNGTSGAAVGDAKRAGLPEAVTATLDSIDAGNLSAVPAAAGKSVLATTVAIVNVTPGSQQQLVMAAAKIPATGVVQVLYYDNTTGLITIIPATVDPTTGIVTFTAPADGTAAIIG